MSVTDTVGVHLVISHNVIAECGVHHIHSDLIWTALVALLCPVADTNMTLHLSLSCSISCGHGGTGDVHQWG